MTVSNSPGREGREQVAQHQAAGRDSINAAAREGFEHGFLSVPFEVQLLECETNAITPYLREYLPLDGLILEAGSGSGRWVEWLHQEGHQAIGLDWSPQLAAVAASHSKGGYFLAADMRAIPLCNESVAGVVSLGAIEHSVEGPESALAEYFRVIRPGGIAVITVPNFSTFRRWFFLARAPERWLRASPTLRRFIGKPVGRQSLRAAKARTPGPWHAEYIHAEEGWSFYEYQMSKEQLEQVVLPFGIDDDQGVWHTIGFNLTGRWVGEPLALRLNAFGRTLRRILPYGQTCHMIGCLAVRPTDG